MCVHQAIHQRTIFPASCTLQTFTPLCPLTGTEAVDWEGNLNFQFQFIALIKKRREIVDAVFAASNEKLPLQSQQTATICAPPQTVDI